MKERCDREMAAALLLVLFGKNMDVGSQYQTTEQPAARTTPQFVSTQDRLPRLGLKAVKAPSTSCESCQALSALFPIAGARAANTA